MNVWQIYREANKRFFHHWASYVAVIFGTTLIVGLVAVSAFTWLTSWMLRLGNVPYVSYNNLGQIILGHPLVALGLVAELLAVVVVIFWQFAFILLSVQNIQRDKPESWGEVLGRTIASLQGASPFTFIFFLGYFIVVLPFGSVFLSTPLLNKVKIPGFILEFLLQNPLYTAGLVAIYLVVGYIGIRLFLVLPLMIIQHQSAREAMHQSLKKTKGHFWFYTGSLALVVGVKALIVLITYVGVYLAQVGMDNTRFAFAAAMVNLFLMEIVSEFLNSYVTVLIAALMINGSNDFVIGHRIASMRFTSKRRGAKVLFRIVVGSTLVLTVGIVVLLNVMLLNGVGMSKPMTISHRGVDNGNGVQNTVPALRKTSKEKPDYVEMDIHETKDHQFVVMHDENLENLAGVNKEPHQLTLKQITKLTVRENGHHAKIPSFDRYLKTAHQLHQKLLVEIKVTPYDSANMTELFIQRYQKSLLKHHDRIHTLSYPVVTQLKQKAPKLFVSFILPYNLTFPETHANAYTMEATTLDSDFVSSAERRHQQVYAWTVDDTDQMDQMMFLQVDGIITDQLHMLKGEIKQNTDHPSYANLLLAFMSELNSEENSSAV